MTDNISLHPATDAPTVLIVDDNCLSRKMLRDMLQVFGYRTILCDSGGGGLAMIRAHRPDVIVMDLNLPGIAGLEVTRWVRQDARLRSTPIIAITAYAREESERKAVMAMIGVELREYSPDVPSPWISSRTKAWSVSAAKTLKPTCSP